MTEGKKKVLVIGAAGSIGTHLLAELIRRDYTPVAALHRRCLHSHTHSLTRTSTYLLTHSCTHSVTYAIAMRSDLNCAWLCIILCSPLPDDLAQHAICEFGFNIRDDASIRSIFEKHQGTIDAVWNLAAPLSVDTANDPTSAYDITVGGMRRVLECMREFGVRKICFSDSIGKKMLMMYLFLWLLVYNGLSSFNRQLWNVISSPRRNRSLVDGKSWSRPGLRLRCTKERMSRFTSCLCFSTWIWFEIYNHSRSTSHSGM